MGRGGKTFVADNTTEFKQEKVQFAEAVMVKVKFWSDVNDVNYAMKIETKFRPNMMARSRNNGSRWREGMAAGKVITIPESRIGVWIGALEYATDSETKFEEKRGVRSGHSGACSLPPRADGARIADSIEPLPGWSTERMKMLTWLGRLSDAKRWFSGTGDCR